MKKLYTHVSSIFIALLLLIGVLQITACSGEGGSNNTAPNSEQDNDTAPNSEQDNDTAPNSEQDNSTTPNSAQDNTLLEAPSNKSSRFGNTVVILNNGNVVVTDPGNSSFNSNSGAVHLYSSKTRTLIASIFGDLIDTQLGKDSDNIIPLPNNNFIISASTEDENGLIDAGTIRLIDGTTGKQIGNTIAGDNAFDELGKYIKVLPNNNFVAISNLNAGSVTLFDGTTGEKINQMTISDISFSSLSGFGIKVLPNNNFLVHYPYDSSVGSSGAGSVRLMNGLTGEQIGETIIGEEEGDQLGRGGVIPLNNNNFIILSHFDDEGGIRDNGSLRLINGITGEQIGETIIGEEEEDQLGRNAFTILPNNNLIVGSHNSKKIRIIDSTTGLQIGETIIGLNLNPFDGNITALPNNNFVVANPLASSGGEYEQNKVGSVRLFNGETGNQIGETIWGNSNGDNLSHNGITALANNNFVVASQYDDENGITDAGSVRLISGETGVQIAAIVGDSFSDLLAWDSVTALPNNNFVIASPYDTENNIENSGSIRLVSGTTGEQIGTTISGAVKDDRVGYFFVYDSVTAVPNNNFVIVSPEEDVNNNVDLGTIRIMDGATGKQGDIFNGKNTKEFSSAQIITSSKFDFYLIAISNKNNGNQLDSGYVHLIPND